VVANEAVKSGALSGDAFSQRVHLSLIEWRKRARQFDVVANVLELPPMPITATEIGSERA
jgi:hypothetical protein